MNKLKVRLLTLPAFWITLVIFVGGPWLLVQMDVTNLLVAIPLISAMAVVGGTIIWHWIMVPTVGWNKETDYGGILLMIISGLTAAVVVTPVAQLIKTLV